MSAKSILAKLLAWADARKRKPVEFGSREWREQVALRGRGCCVCCHSGTGQIQVFAMMIAG